MEQNNKYIEELLEKFFEGLTSNAEEQKLYKYFSENNDIPNHLERYKSMFQYFETELKDELNTVFGEKDKVIIDIDDKKKNNVLPRKWIIGISTIAASLLLLLYINPFGGSNDFNPYEGSYVKKNGVVIYDRAEIEAEQARIELLVEQKLACLDKPFLNAEEKLEEYKDMENQIQLMTN